MKNKFVFLSMKIINGEYEYNSRSTHQLPADQDLIEYSREYAKDFYGQPPEPYQFNEDPDDYWYFNGGEVAARCNTIEEITEEEYNVLNKFLWK